MVFIAQELDIIIKSYISINYNLKYHYTVLLGLMMVKISEQWLTRATNLGKTE